MAHFHFKSKLSWGIFVFCISVLILSAGQIRAAEIDDILIVSHKLLDLAGMKMDWQLNLPLKEKENIDRMYVFADYLYVLSDNNYIFCIDRQRGKIRFEVQLATPKIPIFDPQFYDSKLWFMVGNRLIVLNPQKGVIETSKRIYCLGISAASSVSRNEKRLYIASSNNRLNAINAEEYWREFSVATDDDSYIYSVIAGDSIVIFATQKGNIICIPEDFKERKKLWQYDIVGTLSAPIVRDGSSVYVSGEDTKLYKLNVATGQTEWPLPFITGNILTESAVVGRDVVYQYAGPEGLFAVDKVTGKAVWNVKNGKNLIAEIEKNKAYIFVAPGKVALMNNEKGELVYMVNFANVTDFAVNLYDESLYVADDTGRVASLKEK